MSGVAVVGQVRDHYRKHRAGPGNCGWCDLWRAYKARDLSALDRIFSGPYSNEVKASARVIRSGWGEADWTAGDLA